MESHCKPLKMVEHVAPTGPFRPISCPEDLQASSRLLEEAVRAVAQAQREEPTQRQEPSEAFAGLLREVQALLRSRCRLRRPLFEVEKDLKNI